AVASVEPERPRVRFDDEAVARVHAFSCGAPRLINVVCDNCLLMGFVREARSIGVELAERSIRDMVAVLSAEPSTAWSGPASLERPLSLAG
ncbi:MAG: hypothetical protein AAGA57_08945, partial [Planctomycetota bacterium]